MASNSTLSSAAHLLAGFWAVVVRVFLWERGYGEAGFTMEAVLPTAAAANLFLAAPVWLEMKRALQASSVFAASTFVYWVVFRVLLGRSSWPDYIMMILQVLAVYFSLRSLVRGKWRQAGSARPLDLPVFG